MTFFRQAALLLPSAFLLGVLLFLLTHGRQDPGFGTYPFFEQWAGGKLVAATPEARFVEQAFVFFVPSYCVALLFTLCVAMGEKALFGPRRQARDSPFARAFAPTFACVFLLISSVLVVVGDRLAAKYAPGAMIAPVLVAAAPFAGAVLAVVPAAVLAAPLAFLSKADPT